MTAPGKTLSRGEMLKQLRTKHSASVERTQAILKEQKHVQQEICRVLRERPKTVPEVAAEIGMATDKVLWYMASFKKYGLVVENGMCGDYPLYQKAEENKT
jgi:DNA-directed RNA polymerase specialized sigma subunit